MNISLRLLKTLSFEHFHTNLGLFTKYVTHFSQFVNTHLPLVMQNYICSVDLRIKNLLSLRFDLTPTHLICVMYFVNDPFESELSHFPSNLLKVKSVIYLPTYLKWFRKMLRRNIWHILYKGWPLTGRYYDKKHSFQTILAHISQKGWEKGNCVYSNKQKNGKLDFIHVLPCT